MPTPNLALGKPSTQSSICSWSAGKTREEDAAFANDGVFDHGREYGNHTEHEPSPWWQVDLGAPHVVDTVRLHNRRTHAGRLRFFSILFSTDGESWRVVFRKGDPSVFGPDGEGAFTAAIDTPHLARWVRIRLDDFQSLNLRQVELFGRLPSPQELRASEHAADAAAAELAAFTAGRDGTVVPLAHFELFADRRYSPLILGAFARNDYEGQERHLLRQVLRPEDRVIEIGTAVGVIAMTAAAATSAESVATYEANPHVLADARRNFRHNGYAGIVAKNAVLKNRACWGGPGETARFHISREFWSSRMDLSGGADDIVEVVEVPTLCLEDEIEAHRASFMICDIEGGEIDLLMDADLSCIDALLLETHYWAVGQAATSDLIRKLVRDGLDIHLDHRADHVTFFQRDLGRRVR